MDASDLPRSASARVQRLVVLVSGSGSNLQAVLDACVENNVAVELNAHPARLDLKDTHLMRAKKKGAKVVISTDAHRAPELDLMSYGVEQGRRAWLEPGDVINCWPLEELLVFVGK